MKPPRVYFVRALEWCRDSLEPFSHFTSKICSKVILCQNEIKFPLLSPYLVFAFTWTKKKNVPNMSTRQTTPSTCHGLTYCTGKSWMKLQKKIRIKNSSLFAKNPPIARRKYIYGYVTTRKTVQMIRKCPNQLVLIDKK